MTTITVGYGGQACRCQRLHVCEQVKSAVAIGPCPFEPRGHVKGQHHVQPEHLLSSDLHSPTLEVSGASAFRDTSSRMELPGPAPPGAPACQAVSRLFSAAEKSLIDSRSQRFEPLLLVHFSALETTCAQHLLEDIASKLFQSWTVKSAPASLASTTGPMPFLSMLRGANPETGTIRSRTPAGNNKAKTLAFVTVCQRASYTGNRRRLFQFRLVQGVTLYAVASATRFASDQTWHETE